MSESTVSTLKRILSWILQEMILQNCHTFRSDVANFRHWLVFRDYSWVTTADKVDKDEYDAENHSWSSDVSICVLYPIVHNKRRCYCNKCAGLQRLSRKTMLRHAGAHQPPLKPSEIIQLELIRSFLHRYHDNHNLLMKRVLILLKSDEALSLNSRQITLHLSSQDPMSPISSFISLTVQFPEFAFRVQGYFPRPNHSSQIMSIKARSCMRQSDVCDSKQSPSDQSQSSDEDP